MPPTSVLDPVHREIFRAKVGKGGIIRLIRSWQDKLPVNGKFRMSLSSADFLQN